MNKFNIGDKVRAIASPYTEIGILVGQTGEIVSSSGLGNYEVFPDEPNNLKHVRIWPFVEDWLELVEEIEAVKPETKFKVGDKVRATSDKYMQAGIRFGQIGTIASVIFAGEEDIEPLYGVTADFPNYEADRGYKWSMFDEDIELVSVVEDVEDQNPFGVPDEVEEDKIVLGSRVLVVTDRWDRSGSIQKGKIGTVIKLPEPERDTWIRVEFGDGENTYEESDLAIYKEEETVKKTIEAPAVNDFDIPYGVTTFDTGAEIKIRKPNENNSVVKLKITRGEYGLENLYNKRELLQLVNLLTKISEKLD